MEEPLLAPTPRAPVVRFDVDASPAPSPASTPPAASTASSAIPPPPASPARGPVADPSSSSSANPPPTSSSSLFRYSDSDDDGPVASTSNYAQASQYPPPGTSSSTYPGSSHYPHGPDDSEDYDDRDWGGGDRPLMEGIAYKGLRRASLDLRGEERRLKELEREGEEAEPPEWLTRGGGVWAGVSNLSNSILGAGIIGACAFSSLCAVREVLALTPPRPSFAGLPYALREAGFFAGIVLLVIVGIVTDWTIRLIVLNAKMSGRRTCASPSLSAPGPSFLLLLFLSFLPPPAVLPSPSLHVT